MKYIKAFLVVFMFGFVFFQIMAWATEPNGNLIMCAGDVWDAVAPGNYSGGHRFSVKQNIADNVGFFGGPNNSIFYASRFESSASWGNPAFSWLSGKLPGQWAHSMSAIEFNPTQEFADLNGPICGEDNAHYALLMFQNTVYGANDPTRNYHIPAAGGTVLSDDRTFAYAEAGWPTQLGVDVKLRMYQWTTPFAHMDDMVIYEMEFYNTGFADIDADGDIDLGGTPGPDNPVGTNKIYSLVTHFKNEPWLFYVKNEGTREYCHTGKYRGFGQDLTPDANNSPEDIAFSIYGASLDTYHDPGLADWQLANGWYHGIALGYTYLGAKKYDEASGMWDEKYLSFKDASGNEVVPAVGEGTQRGWFHTYQVGENGVGDLDPKTSHIAAMGSFYVDGGKGNSSDLFDLNPNPNLFASGTAGDPTTFVVKDPSQWQFPDGALESFPSVMAKDLDGTNLGMNPLHPTLGRPLEPGIITEGIVTEYNFNDPLAGCGPFSLEPGERIRVYFVRGAGHRILGLRKTIDAARTIYANYNVNAPLDLPTINPTGREVFNVPVMPPVPDIELSVTADVRPEIKFQDPATLGDFDGVKIYKSKVWPRYNPLYKGTPTHDTWWKTMDATQQADPVAINPLFTAVDKVVEQQGNIWGPYELVKVIPASELSNYTNTDADAGTYAYAWEDDTPGTLAGFTFWYYIATYKNNPSLGDFASIENVNWIESGKVNVNGRTGVWEGAHPYAEGYSWYPDASDKDGLKAIGAKFVLNSPTKTVADIELDRAQIGVRPNPYKRAAFHDVIPEHKLLFYNLPEQCDITIFDVAGMLVDKIEFSTDDETNGTYFWDMHSKNGNEVASGLYIWVVEYKGGSKQGYFSIIR
ncbi:hypothetical protein JW960_18190 [candidate division KSB1 bacterium]|nr:hypothetical protein [candidate division KSB1 bacterium]